MSSSSIITQTVTAIIKAFSVPITANENACRLFHSPTPYLLLLFHFNNQIQFIQLLLVNSRRCIQHYIASTVVLGECNAVADTVETCEDADPTVQTVCQTTVRSAPYLKAFIRKPNCS